MRFAWLDPLRATTINDFEKLGTALGGTPTIVERLPSRAAERRCSRQDAVRVCPPPSRELKPPAPGRAASASAVGSALRGSNDDFRAVASSGSQCDVRGRRALRSRASCSLPAWRSTVTTPLPPQVVHLDHWRSPRRLPQRPAP